MKWVFLCLKRALVYSFAYGDDYCERYVQDISPWVRGYEFIQSSVE
jgi:hypothetical protein